MVSSFSAEYALRTLLQSNAAFIAAIGGMDKVFTALAPHTAPAPYCILRTENVKPSNDKVGPSELDGTTIDLHIFTTTHTKLIEVAEVARQVLDYHSGIVLVDTDEYQIEHLEFDTAANGGYDEDKDLYQFTVRFFVQVRRGLSVSMAAAFVYVSDTAAAAGGVSLGATYELAVNNHYGMPQGMFKKRRT